MYAPPSGPLLITKRGKPVAKLVPVEEDDMDDFIGRLNGVFRVVADIESPIEPPEAWESTP
ncbi:MAG: type II toxin-antitoxin system Phd/YefM family antitoxin [Candidatus Sulfotelmatobacter sp.]